MFLYIGAHERTVPSPSMLCSYMAHQKQHVAAVIKSLFLNPPGVIEYLSFHAMGSGESTSRQPHFFPWKRQTGRLKIHLVFISIYALFILLNKNTAFSRAKPYQLFFSFPKIQIL